MGSRAETGNPLSRGSSRYSRFQVLPYVFAEIGTGISHPVRVGILYWSASEVSPFSFTL